MFEKLTEKSRQAILKAQEYVRARQQQDVQIAHLLRGMIDVDDANAGVGYLLKKLNINLTELTNKLAVIMDQYPKVYGVTNYGSHLSKDASTAVQIAQTIAAQSGDEFVAIDTLLLGVLKVETDATARLLRTLGVKETELDSAIKELRKGKKVSSESSENEFNALEKKLIRKQGNYSQAVKHELLQSQVYLQDVDSVKFVFIFSGAEGYGRRPTAHELIPTIVEVQIDYKDVNKNRKSIHRLLSVPVGV